MDKKQRLYFKIDMNDYLLYNYDQKTTCNTILKENKESIKKIVGKSNIDNYDFFLIDIKSIKKNQTNFTKVRINHNLCLSSIVNPKEKAILFFMEKAQTNDESKTKDQQLSKNEIISEKKERYLEGKICENILQKKTVFLYDYNSRIFVKTKANLTEKQLTILGKTDTNIFFDNVISLKFCDSKDLMVESLEIKNGFKPPFFIIIKTSESQDIIGLKNEEKVILWKENISSVLTKYKNFRTDRDLNKSINDLKIEINKNEKNIIEDALNLKNFMKKKEKEKIFYSFFQDQKEVLELLEKIVLYQEFLNQKNIKEVLIKLYEILTMIKGIIKEKNPNQKSIISELISQEQLKSYVKIYDKANEDIAKSNGDNIINILQINLFDDFIKLLNENCNKEFEKPSQIHEKSNQRKIVQSLVAYYFTKFINYTYKDSFLELK